MSHLNPGLISAYNSLTDKHLAGYFSNTRIRRHLHRAGLITRSGRIVPDKEYRQKLIQKAHQRHVRECLAQAIFHKVLEMERLHQIEIKRKLEEFARRDRVHKIKVERSKRYEEDIIRIFSPHPPSGARGVRKQHSGPEGEHTESSESPGSSRPNTAPGKMQRPVRLKPLHSNSTTASHRHSSPYRRQHHPPHQNQRAFNGTMDKDPDRRLNPMEVRNGISPYCLPVINNFVTPVPPSTRRKERPIKHSTSGPARGRRLRPTTASSTADVTEDPPSMLRSSVPQSRVCVRMVYLGKTVHLSNDLPDFRDEVKVFQQHCGGENLCVYKGKLRERESFQFISRRHRGFPFSLTFFLNGLQVERLSSCCEFKHRKSSRLGGRHGHFAFTGVEAASPCYKCIIAMGLDKKPVPPPKRMKDDAVRLGLVPTLKITSGADTETTKGEDPVSRSECESNSRKDTKKRVNEDKASEELKVKDDYEEDFEADDEGPLEEERENKRLSPKDEKEERATGVSDSEGSEKKGDIKSRSGSSFTGSDQEESEVEEVKEAKAEDKEDQPEEAPEEVQESAPRVEAATAPSTEAPSSEAKDCEIQDSAGQSTEIEISDSSGPSGNENRATSDTAAEGERKTDDNTQDEPERAKSVQEKLAEAILKESHCSSEPELSDTSTETEASSNKSAAKAKEAVTEISSAQQDIAEVKKIENPVTQEVKAEVHTREVQEEIAEENVVQDDQVSERSASEEVKEPSEEETPEIVEDGPTSALKEDSRDDQGKDAEVAEEDGGSVQNEDESAASELCNKLDEGAEAENTMALTGTETMEMKDEAAEPQEAIRAEEGPPNDTLENDVKQEAEEQTGEEREDNTKDELIGENSKEESVSENEKKPRTEGNNGGQEVVEEQSDLIDGAEDKSLKEEKIENIEESKTDSVENEEGTKVSESNLTPDDQNEESMDNSEKDEGLVGVSNQDGAVICEENIAEVKELENGLNTAQVRDDIDKVSSEKDASEKPTEEMEKTVQDSSLNEETGREKTDEESITKEEAQHTESEAQEIPQEGGDNEGHGLDNDESTLDKVEGKETSADRHEDNAQLIEKNIRSEDVAADTENTGHGDEVFIEENKDMSNKNEMNEVDEENGEVSAVAETKHTAGGVKQEVSESKINEPHNVEDNGKVENSNELEKAELKQENDSNRDSNDVASVPLNADEIVKPIIKDLDPTEHNNNENISRSNSDKPTEGQVEKGEDSAAVEGENGDTEEASKASEEGASVLLNPQVTSSLSEHVNETEPKGSPEGLTTADSADLVNNWVTMHQTSKYFETFVEPLEEIREVNSEASNDPSLELPRSESLSKIEHDDKKDSVTDTKDEPSVIASHLSEVKQDVLAKDPAEEESQGLAEANVEKQEYINKHVNENSSRSQEDQTVRPTEGQKILDNMVQVNNSDMRTSIASSHLTITSGIQTVSEILKEEKASQNGQDVTKVEDAKMEELPESSGNVLAEHMTSAAQESCESKDMTVTKEFTVSTSDSMNQWEPRKTPNGSISGEQTELMEGSSHAVSKDLSSFSADNTCFGQSSLPLLTASKAD